MLYNNTDDIFHECPLNPLATSSLQQLWKNHSGIPRTSRMAVLLRSGAAGSDELYSVSLAARKRAKILSGKA